MDYQKLGEAFRKAMNERDLTIKEAAALLERSEETIKRARLGKKLSERTTTRIQLVFALVT